MHEMTDMKKELNAFLEELKDHLMNGENVPKKIKDEIRMIDLSDKVRDQIRRIVSDATFTPNPDEERIKFITDHLEIVKKALDDAEKEIKKTFDKKPDPDFRRVSEEFKNFPDGRYEVRKATVNGILGIEIKKEEKDNA